MLPHERTTPDSTDRLELTRATEANLSPVWGLSLAGGLTRALAEPAEPLGCVAEDGSNIESSASPIPTGSLLSKSCSRPTTC